MTINGRDDWATPFPDFGERTKNKQFLSRSESEERESERERLPSLPSFPPPFSLHSIPSSLCSTLLPTLSLAFPSIHAPTFIHALLFVYLFLVRPGSPQLFIRCLTDSPIRMGHGAICTNLQEPPNLSLESHQDGGFFNRGTIVEAPIPDHDPTGKF